MVLAVQRFFLGIERRVFLFELINFRQFLQPDSVEILLRRLVQNYVGGIAIVKAIIPPARLILSVDLARFSVSPDLFLEFGNFFLPRFDFFDPLRNFQELSRRGRRLFLQFVVTVDSDFFKINQSSRGFFQIKNLRPLSIPRALALGNFGLNVNQQTRTFLRRGILGGFAICVVGSLSAFDNPRSRQSLNNRFNCVILAERILTKKLLTARRLKRNLLAVFEFRARAF